MNLAAKDIRHNFGRFALTTVGIGLLLMIVMGMGGIYRGLIREATLLVDNIGADLWVVQGDTRGPFAEISRVPANLEDRARAVPGVASARRLFRTRSTRTSRPAVAHRGAGTGLAGRSRRLDSARRRTSAAPGALRDDRRSFARPGTRRENPARQGRLRSGRPHERHGGFRRRRPGLLHVSDAQAIQFDLPGEAIRLERQARRARVEGAGHRPGATAVARTRRRSGERHSRAAPPQVSAVMVTIQPGADAGAVAATISTWPDVTVYSQQQQKDLLLSGMVDKARRQLGLFRVLLIIISTIIMALIIYTLTLDKIHDIAMLKLMGARNRVIVGLILQQALLIGALGYGLAYWLGTFAFPEISAPRGDRNARPALLAGIVLGISVLASLLGICKAMRVEPNKVLS
jgi:putative ABC transport system permease protein